MLREELARAARRQQEAVDAVERSHADRLRTTQAELDAARGIAAEGTAQLKQLAREAEDEARGLRKMPAPYALLEDPESRSRNAARIAACWSLASAIVKRLRPVPRYGYWLRRRVAKE